MTKITDAITSAKHHLGLGNNDAAKKILVNLDRKHPALTEVITLLGVITGNEGNYAACAKYFERATKLQPAVIENWYYKGVAFQKMCRHPEAILAFTRALELHKDFFEALHDRANSLRETGSLHDALADLSRAIAIDKSHFQVFYNRGLTHGLLEHYDAEIADYHSALSLCPQSTETLINLSVAYSLAGHPDKSVEYINKALNRDKHSAAALTLRGELFFGKRLYQQAVEDYRVALSIKPDYPAALAGMAALFDALKKPDEAAALLARLLKCEPGYPFAVGRLAHVEAMSCNWQKVEQLLPIIQKRVLMQEKVVSPFHLLGMVDNPELHLLAAKTQLAESFPICQILNVPSDYMHARVRVAYVSNDFHEHATSMLIAGVFEEHSREHYEIFAISYGPDDKSQMRQRIEASVDSFIDVSGKSDKEVAQLMKDLEIDIAVDLKGFTTDSRLGIFSYRPASIQVSYLGYPGTTAAPYIDFLLADSTVVTEKNRKFFSEKIAYLPNSYQPNDRKRNIPELSLTRADYGLPENVIVFASFNNSYKISRAAFALWLDIVRSVPSSVLWLLKTSEIQKQHIISAAKALDFDSDRIVFAARVSPDENLSRLRLADIYFDNLPYNAHTSASDALWAGVPIFTVPGESFASRVAMSLLHALDMAELVFDNAEALKKSVLEHAASPEKLSILKKKIATNKLSTPLFDTSLMTKHIEMAFTEMLLQKRSGNSLSDFSL